MRPIFENVGAGQSVDVAADGFKQRSSARFGFHFRISFCIWGTEVNLTVKAIAPRVAV